MIKIILNKEVICFLMRFTIILNDPRTTTKSNFSLVEQLLDLEQEFHHRCEGRSFVSHFFASTSFVVTEGTNDLEFRVATIITCNRQIKYLNKKQ